MKHIAFVSLLILAFASCKKESQSEKDAATIQAYLDSHPEIDAKRHSSGIYYQIYEPGIGGSPTIFSTVTVKYKGYLTNNEVFDETAEGKTFTRKLTEVISGWQIAVPLLQKGGKGIFLIPSEFGYGDNKVGDIPKNSVLIFEIELIDF